MLESFEKMKWEDIYSYWRISTEDHLNIVNNTPDPITIPVQRNGENRTYAYLWIKNSQIKQAQNMLEQSVKSPIYQHRNVLPDERVIRAADLMVQAKSDEERVAIWLWIFCTSLEKAQLPFPNSKYIELVGAKVRLLLQEHFDEWIFRYHHRFPHLFIGSDILSKVKFERYSVIVDFAIMNAYMIRKEYSIVLFDSEPEKKEPPFSYRNLGRNNMIEVVAALIWDGDRFLICQRPEHKARGLLWEYVGGKVEPGETKQEALIRECREELGITISVGDIFMDVVHEYPDITVHLTLFHAQIVRGEIRLLEHNAIAWITPAEIPNYSFCPADKDINERIQAEKFVQMVGESK